MVEVGVIFETKWGDTFKRWKIVCNPKPEGGAFCLVSDYEGMQPGELRVMADETHIAASANSVKELMRIAQVAAMY